MSEERDDGGLPADDVELDEPELEEEQLEEEGTGDDQPSEPDEEPEAAAQQTRRPGRRERQSAELRELRERSDRLERELQSVRQQPQPRPDNSAELARIAAYERDQLPLLPPDQIARYYDDKTRREVGAILHQQQAQIADQLDRAAWQASLAGNARRSRFAAQVEQTIQGMAPGPSRQREVVYKYLFGDEMDRQAARKAPGQRAAAQRRVQSQRTQPGGGRSDVARDRQPSGGGDDYEGALSRVRGRALW